MKKQTTTLRRRSFERIVVLVDITIIVLQHDNKKLFAAHLFNSVSRILEQCNQHSKLSTQWGYKFFDPSHPPLASRSKIGEFLGGEGMSGQFDAFGPNLKKFGKVLELIVNNHRQYNSEGSSRGAFVARAISDVICGYTWDPLLASDSSSSDEERLASKEPLGAKRDSNAIILFSSVPTTWTSANCFFNSPQLVGDVRPDPSAQSLLAKTFRSAREALNSRDIQVCFVDVPMHQGFLSDERLETVLKPTAARSLILKSLSHLVRTVITSDLLVMSPTLLPFTLVWNTVADLGIEKSGKRTHAHILCQGGTHLCEVQLQPFKVVHTSLTSRGMSVLKTKLHPATDNLDIVLESVQPKSSLNMKLTSERFLVRQSVRPQGSTLGEDRDSFGDQVLQLLDQSAFRPGQPEWQLLLLTLASIKSVCEVSLRNHEDSHSLRAVLEPFTSQCAILTVLEREITSIKTDRMTAAKIETREESVPGQAMNVMKRTKDAVRSVQHEGVTVIPSRKRRKVAASAEAVINWEEYWEREGITTASTEFTSCDTVLSRYIQGGKASQTLLIMDSLFKVGRQPNRKIDLFGGLAVMDEGVEPFSDEASAPTPYPDNSDPAVHSSIVSGQNAEPKDLVQVQEASEILAEDDTKVEEDRNAIVLVDTSAQEFHPTPSTGSPMTSEEAKEYIASVGQRVQDYLTSTDFDSRRFAEMLVAESYRSLYVLTGQTEDDQQRSDTVELAEQNSNRKMAVKLKKLLLKGHKELLAKYKKCVGSPSADTCSATADDKVREYELQILLRLEMMSFDKGLLLEQIGKDQLTKDICKLLQNIQFHLPGGIFGGKEFLKYCDRLLVCRYREKIPSITSKIYSEMELDGYSTLPTLSSAQATSYQETSYQASTNTGDLLLGEGGVSQDSISFPGKSSHSGTGGLPSGVLDPEYAASQPTLERRSNRKTSRKDPKRQAQSSIFDNGSKKKGSYQFKYTGFLTRLVKSSGSHTSAQSKRSKGRRWPNDPVSDDPFQIDFRTLAPMAAPSALRAGDEPQVATMPPPKELPGCLPKHQGVSVELPPSVVEATPVVRRRLALQNFGQENTTFSEISLDDMVADIDRTSDAVPNITAPYPSNVSVRLLCPEPCKKSVRPAVSSGMNQGILSRDPAAVGKFGSYRGSQICHNNDDDDDDDDDDDEDAIISTPFKVNNASGQSLLSLHSSQLDRPACHKRLGKENIKTLSIIGF